MHLRFSSLDAYKNLNMKIFEAIRKDHDIQRILLRNLTSTSGATEERKRIYYQLKRELKIHANAEERHFYVPLFENDSSQDQARHGVAEHHEMDEIIAQMDQTDFSSPAWLLLAKKLEEKVLHHLKDEEQEFFQLAGKVLNENQKKNLGKDYIIEMNDERILELTP